MTTSDQLPDSSEVVPFTSEFVSQVQVALGKLAAWGVRIHGAEQLSEIIDVISKRERPVPGLVELQDLIGDLELNQIADHQLLRISLDELVKSLLCKLTKRQRQVFLRRRIENAKLQEIGLELGLTRERVRQIAKDADRSIQVELQKMQYQPIRWHAMHLRETLGAAAPLDHEITLQAFRQIFGESCSEESRTLENLVLHVAGPYRKKEGWLSAIAINRSEIRSLHELADEHGLLPVATAHEWLDQRGINERFRDLWLQRFGKFRREGDTLMVWKRNVIDKCVALLALRMKPADVKTLVSLVGEGHNARGVRQRLFGDERVVRVTRNDWALRIWGLEEFTKITDEISQLIDRSGGEAELQPIIDTIAKQFKVREGSVFAYTTAPLFVTDSGLIRMRRENEPFAFEGGLADIGGGFAPAPDTVSTLINVDAEALRGSGRSLKAQIAISVGINPGDKRTFKYDENSDLRITWPMTSFTGPTLGSIRKMVHSVGAKEGERIRIELHAADGLVRCVRVPNDLFELENSRALQLLTGINEVDGNWIAAIAESLNVNPANVRRILYERGDAEILDLLPDVNFSDELDGTLEDLATIVFDD